MEFVKGIAAVFVQGGLMMYPLVVCSFLVMAVIIERWLYFRSAAKLDSHMVTEVGSKLKNGEWKEAVEWCAGGQGIISAMLAQGLAEPTSDRQQLEQELEGTATRLVAKLRYRLDLLDTIVTLAPLLGLLGTVTGMIQTFNVLTIKNGQPLAITGGIGEALLATATGLCVAVLALVGHSYFTHRIDEIINTLEDAANHIVKAALYGRTSRHEVQ